MYFSFKHIHYFKTYYGYLQAEIKINHELSAYCKNKIKRKLANQQF